jgi:hypothetical protein
MRWHWMGMLLAWAGGVGAQTATLQMEVPQAPVAVRVGAVDHRTSAERKRLALLIARAGSLRHLLQRRGVLSWPEWNTPTRPRPSHRAAH